MHKLEIVIKKLQKEFSKIKGYFDKKNNMFIILWYGFVVGKYTKELFESTNSDLIVAQVKKLIRRIKIIYSNSKEIKTAKSLK